MLRQIHNTLNLVPIIYVLDYGVTNNTGSKDNMVSIRSFIL